MRALIATTVVLAFPAFAEPNRNAPSPMRSASVTRAPERNPGHAADRAPEAMHPPSSHRPPNEQSFHRAQPSPHPAVPVPHRAVPVRTSATMFGRGSAAMGAQLSPTTTRDTRSETGSTVIEQNTWYPNATYPAYPEAYGTPYGPGPDSMAASSSDAPSDDQAPTTFHGPKDPIVQNEVPAHAESMGGAVDLAELDATDGLYHWTDADGVEHFADEDSVPPEIKASVQKQKMAPLSGVAWPNDVTIK